MSGELQFLFLALWKNSNLYSIYSRDNIVFIGERILVSDGSCRLANGFGDDWKDKKG